MKHFILFNLALILTISVSAQKQKFYAGLNGAIQNTWIFCSTDFDEGGILDFETTFRTAFGLDLGYQFTPNYGLQTGILYSQQGQKYTTAGNTNANYTTDLSYLKIPVLFCYTHKPLGKLSFIAQAGFQFSLLTEALSSRDRSFLYYSPGYVDVKDSYASVPIEIVLAVGIQMNFENMNVSLLIRPDYSLTDIEKTEKKPGLRSPASNFTIAMPQLGFHYYF
ncbi:MAG: PorT family protein [Saprospiraceae bacterium]|nr:PorT family protein [Saprospiraceae bacterium]